MVRKLALVVFLLMLSVSAFAQITATPATMNFQGRLARPDGTPVANGTYTLTFRLYDQQIGGTVRWAEQIGSVVVRNGVFSCVLGNILPFNETHLNGTVWLEIQVNTDPPLIPSSAASSRRLCPQSQHGSRWSHHHRQDCRRSDYASQTRA